ALNVGEGDRITLRTRLCGLDFRDRPGTCRVARARSFRIVGVAVTAAARPYPDVCVAPECAWYAEAMEGKVPEGPPPDEPPREGLERLGVPQDPVEPGLVWLTVADARGLAAAGKSLSYVMNLKLADPTAAPAFVSSHSGAANTGETILES